MTLAKGLLALALAGLTVLFAVWFHGDRHWLATQLIFTLPALLLLLAVLARRRTAGFWSGVIALAWFSHGVMVAWSRPAEATQAWLEILLALLVIGASSLPGLRKRFSKKRARTQ